MHADGIKATGEVRLQLFGPDGKLKDKRHVQNLVVTAGLAVLADRMKGTPLKGEMTHMAVGEGTTAAAAGDTDLETPVGSRQTLTTGVSGAVITYSRTFAAGESTNSALTEAGLFNASTGGDMLCRTVFTAINKGGSDSLAITWTVTLS